MFKKALKAAFPLTLPVLAGYLCIGIGFGVMLQSKGYSLWWAVLMSFTIYSGSMQYVGVDLLSGGAALLSSALLTLMVNARYLFYSISMVARYHDTGKFKPVLVFQLTDETYSLICTKQPPEDVSRPWFFFCISTLDQLYWIAGSLIGAVAGSALRFDSTGIDFAMTALFLVIFLEQWTSSKRHWPALMGIGVSLLGLLVFGPDRFVIPSMLAITLILAIVRGAASRRAEKTPPSLSAPPSGEEALQ